MKTAYAAEDSFRQLQQMGPLLESIGTADDSGNKELVRISKLETACTADDVRVCHCHPWNILETACTADDSDFAGGENIHLLETACTADDGTARVAGFAAGIGNRLYGG